MNPRFPPAVASTAHPRITIEPGTCGGKPCIRGMRLRVSDVLELLTNGVSVEEILADHPYLEWDDILAAIAYAAQQTNRIVFEVASGFWSITSCLLPWPIGSATVDMMPNSCSRLFLRLSTRSSPPSTRGKASSH